MPAVWASSNLVVSGRPQPATRQLHPILASIQPALDTAFGLEPLALFPEEIVAWVDRLAGVLDASPTAAEVAFLEAA